MEYEHYLFCCAYLLSVLRLLERLLLSFMNSSEQGELRRAHQ